MFQNKNKLLQKFGQLGHLGNGGRVVGADESVGVGGVADHQHLHRLLSLGVQGLPLHLYYYYYYYYSIVIRVGGGGGGGGL